MSERTSKLWRSPIWVQLDSRPHPFPSPYKGEGYRETAAARFYVSERTSYSDRQFGCNYIQYVTTPPRRAGGGKYAHEHLTFLPLSFIRRGVRGEVLRFYVSEPTSYSDAETGGENTHMSIYLAFLPLSFIRRGVRGEVLRFYVSGLYSPILA